MATGYEAAASPPRSRAGRRLSDVAIRDLLLAALTFSSGAVDAIAFLALGKVFTAFQTGNLVFLGIGVAQTGSPGPDLPRVACSLGGFAAGVLLATRVVQSSKGSGLWPRRVSLTLGLTFIAQAIFAVMWMVTSGWPGIGSGRVLAGFSSIAMGLQSGAVMALAVTGVFTTAATATVMFLMRDEAERGSSRAAERARYARVLVALVAGALTGALLLVHARRYAPVLPLAATALVIATGSIALRSRREIT